MKTWREVQFSGDIVLSPGIEYAALVSLSDGVSIDKLEAMARSKGIAGEAWEEGTKAPIDIPKDTEEGHRNVYVQGSIIDKTPVEVPSKMPWPFTHFFVRKLWALTEGASPPVRTGEIITYEEKAKGPILVGIGIGLGLILMFARR